MADQRLIGAVSAAIEDFHSRGVLTYGLADLQDVLIDQFGLYPDEVSVPKIREALLHLERSLSPSSASGEQPSTCSGAPPGFIPKNRK